MNTAEYAYMFVGSYTGKNSKGINCFRFDLRNGALEHLYSKDGIENPSYLAIDAERHFLYAVSETNEGKVASYRVDPETAKLSALSEQPTRGGAPCYVTVDPEGKCLMAVNYSGGSVCAFPIEDGKIGEMTSFHQHEGSSIHSDRQEGPHPHSIVLNGQRAYVPDLGLDQIKIYKLDSKHCKLAFFDKVESHPGAGPRIIAFHPQMPYAYVINELDSTIIAFSYNSLGQLIPIQTVQTLPYEVEGNLSADIHITPSGKFLYGSNRGHDSLAIYKINQENGQLEQLGFTSTEGKAHVIFACHQAGNF